MRRDGPVVRAETQMIELPAKVVRTRIGEGTDAIRLRRDRRCPGVILRWALRRS